MADDSKPAVNVQLTEEEIRALVNTLETARSAFNGMLRVAQDAKDENAVAQIVFHMRRCSAFITRLTAHLKIGEPSDGSLH